MSGLGLERTTCFRPACFRGRMAEAAAVLRTFLQSHKLAPDVTIFILADCAIGLGCEDISDFAGYGQFGQDFSLKGLSKVF